MPETLILSHHQNDLRARALAADTHEEAAAVYNLALAESEAAYQRMQMTRGEVSEAVMTDQTNWVATVADIRRSVDRFAEAVTRRSDAREAKRSYQPVGEGSSESTRIVTRRAPAGTLRVREPRTYATENAREVSFFQDAFRVSRGATNGDSYERVQRHAREDAGPPARLRDPRG